MAASSHHHAGRLTYVLSVNSLAVVQCCMTVSKVWFLVFVMTSKMDKYQETLVEISFYFLMLKNNCLSVYLSVYLSVCLFVYLFVYLLVYQFDSVVT